MLGCLGGSSLMDVDGTIVARVNRYCADYPDASFEEVEQACFPDQDGKIHLYALSPRHFECAMTKTCQILIEGDYFDVFQPNVHYIELKKDYSNLTDVLNMIGDKTACEKIAQRCYDDIVALPPDKNKNTYAWFANHIIDYLVKRISDPCYPKRANQTRWRFFIFFWLLAYHIIDVPNKFILLKIYVKRGLYILLTRVFHIDPSFLRNLKRCLKRAL
jgi:hypothetical protein